MTEGLRRGSPKHPVFLQPGFLRLLFVGWVIVICPGRAWSDPSARCFGSSEPAERAEACSQIITAKTLPPAELARAHRVRGQARLSAGATEEAIADFTSAMALKAGDADAYSGRGQARLTRGDTTGAIADFTEAVRLQPRSGFLHNALGHAHLVSGNAEAALEAFNEAVRLDPDSASARNNRGLARSKLGSLDAAIADYTGAIDVSPLYALAYANRGYAYESKGDKPNALADFARAIEIDPTLAGAREGLTRLGGTPASSDGLVQRGQALAEKNCAWCHAIGTSGASPNAKAPAFRTLATRHPIQALREPLKRGIAAPHEAMPTFKLTKTELESIIAYIEGLARSAKP